MKRGLKVHASTGSKFPYLEKCNQRWSTCLAQLLYLKLCPLRRRMLQRLSEQSGKRADSDGLSTPQKADSICPVPFRSFTGEGGQGSHETARIRRRDGPFVHKNHSAMLSPFFCPDLEQWGNRPSVVGYECQPLRGSLFQTDGVRLS
jgi:hypothetical protein